MDKLSGKKAKDKETEFQVVNLGFTIETTAEKLLDHCLLVLIHTDAVCMMVKKDDALRNQDLGYLKRFCMKNCPYYYDFDNYYPC